MSFLDKLDLADYKPENMTREQLIEILGTYTEIGAARMEHLATISAKVVTTLGKTHLFNSLESVDLLVPSRMMAVHGSTPLYTHHLIELINNIEGHTLISDLPNPMITMANTLVGLEAHAGIVLNYDKKICEREKKLFFVLNKTMNQLAHSELQSETIGNAIEWLLAEFKKPAPAICDHKEKCGGCPLDPQVSMKDVYVFFGKVMACKSISEENSGKQDHSLDKFDIRHMTMQ